MNRPAIEIDDTPEVIGIIARECATAGLKFDELGLSATNFIVHRLVEQGVLKYPPPGQTLVAQKQKEK